MSAQLLLITFQRMEWKGTPGMPVEGPRKGDAAPSTRLVAINPLEVSHLEEPESGGCAVWMRNGQCVWVSAPLLEVEAKLDPSAELYRRQQENRIARTGPRAGLGYLAEVPFEDGLPAEDNER